MPVTHALLMEGGLVLHPSVSCVFLHGSRGPAGGCREDSDVDLSLVVDAPQGDRAELAALLQGVIDTSLTNWKGQVELDLAVVFDVRGCGLVCFEQESWGSEDECALGGVDCFGLYKTQKGFAGFVEGGGVQVRLMHPCTVIWQRHQSPSCGAISREIG